MPTGVSGSGFDILETFEVYLNYKKYYLIKGDNSADLYTLTSRGKTYVCGYDFKTKNVTYNVSDVSIDQLKGLFQLYR